MLLGSLIKSAYTLWNRPVEFKQKISTLEKAQDLSGHNK